MADDFGLLAAASSCLGAGGAGAETVSGFEGRGADAGAGGCGGLVGDDEARKCLFLALSRLADIKSRLAEASVDLGECFFSWVWGDTLPVGPSTSASYDRAGFDMA